MPSTFQPKRLQQARYLKRMSVAELGDAIEVTRQSMRQFETGERTPLPKNVEKMSAVLDVPVEFFLRPVGRLEGSERSVVHYRSLKRTRDLMRAQQYAATFLDLGAALMDTLEQYLEYDASRVPRLVDSSIDVLKLSLEDVEELASVARKRLGLGEGPISDVTLLVENLSIPVIYAPLPDGMDGISAWYADRPFIVVSSAVSHARSRTNVAHEFGHVVIHQDLGDESELDDETFAIVEPQAWRFAGAFLLPAKSFLSEVYNVSLDSLVVLKRKWGVSVAAMIRRLLDLGVIDDAQFKRLRIQLGARKWLKVEPGDDIPREKSRLISRAAEFLAQNGELTLFGLADESRLPRSFLANALEVPEESLLPPPPQNVVQFRMRGS